MRQALGIALRNPWFRGLLALAALYVAYQLAAIWWNQPTPESVALGRTLFVHEWTVRDQLAGGDGLGPVFNGKSCVECHFQGGVGGAGPSDNNVLSFEVLPTPDFPRVAMGVVHLAAIDDRFRESRQDVYQVFPGMPARFETVEGRRFKVDAFDPIRFETINTPPLWGLGLLDKLPAWSIHYNGARRGLDVVASATESKQETIPVGRLRVLPGNRIGRFGWKGQIASLEEFVAAACAVELGLSNRVRRQDKPRAFAEDSAAKPDLSRKQLRGLVHYIASLPRPVQVMPDTGMELSRVFRGEEVFRIIGCADCHTPDLGNVSGVYSDFRLYRVEDLRKDITYYNQDDAEVPIPHHHPKLVEWKTPPLWGVADSAPYFHDGASPTLRHAILRHGGQARLARQRFRELRPSEQEALLSFLGSLRAPQAGDIARPAEVSGEPQARDVYREEERRAN